MSQETRKNMQKKFTEVFPGLALPDPKKDIAIEVGDGAHPLIPEPEKDYRWGDYTLVRTLWFFHRAQTRGTGDRDSLMLFGPHGTGKSSTFNNFYAAIRHPVVTVPCNEEMEPSDLMGHRILDSTGTPFELGPVSYAAENGFPLVLEEYNLLKPKTLTALNNVLERRPVFMKELKRNLAYKAGFYVMVSGNHGGLTDETGMYVGTHTHNISSLDRFITVQAKYLPPAIEEQILCDNELTIIKDDQSRKAMAAALVDLATVIRMLNLGPRADKFLHPEAMARQRAKDIAGQRGDGLQLEVTMSTRMLRRCAKLFLASKDIEKLPEFAGREKPITYALKLAGMDIAATETVNAVCEIGNLIMTGGT